MQSKDSIMFSEIRKSSGTTVAINSPIINKPIPKCSSGGESVESARKSVQCKRSCVERK